MVRCGAVGLGEASYPCLTVRVAFCEVRYGQVWFGKVG
jgi:hypothetical protein